MVVIKNSNKSFVNLKMNIQYRKDNALYMNAYRKQIYLRKNDIRKIAEKRKGERQLKRKKDGYIEKISPALLILLTTHIYKEIKDE